MRNYSYSDQGGVTLDGKRMIIEDIVRQLNQLAEAEAQRDAFKKIVQDAIAIISSHLPPDGISEHDAMSQLCGILDNKKVVRLLREKSES